MTIPKVKRPTNKTNAKTLLLSAVCTASIIASLNPILQIPTRDLTANVALEPKYNSSPWSGTHDDDVVAAALNTASATTNGSFVHVGKTAGSTISILLRHGCHSYMPHPCRDVPHESIASQLIQNYYHVPDFGRLSQSRHDFYVVTCRDPFDRTVSAFVFDHILNRYARGETVDPWKVAKYELAYKCFPTLQQYVELLGTDSKNFTYLFSQRSVNADSCSDLARASFHSRVKIYNHLFFSFRRIKSILPNDLAYDQYAIRKEFLWRDWKSLNAALGQRVESVYIPPESQSQRRNITDDAMPVNRTLNVQGRLLLCRALEDEYRAYFWFLKNAKNLNDGDLELSLQVAMKNCPMAIRRLAGDP